MISKEVIGRESEALTIHVEEAAVRIFAEAIGLPYDGEVPPTFVYTFRGGSVPGLNLPEKGLIHAGQKFIYYRPVKVGDVITYKRRVTDVFERLGKLGKMTFMVLEMEGRNSTGELIFTTTSTLIAREED